MIERYNFSDIIERAIASLPLHREPSGLYEPVTYTLESGGKRLRPMLVLAAGVSCGSEPDNLLNQAIGIEMFHNFTLLHDDVMDRAGMRRGRPTVHVKWNDSTAILSGDAMLTIATMLVVKGAGNKLSEALGLFNSTAMQIYEGQQLDMDFERRLDVTEAEYIEMIRLKTAVLLSCACRMGALMAGADEPTIDAFGQYAVALGLAFQLQDDYLDTYGDPLLFGKNIGGDILNDKKTWLLIKTLEEDSSGRIHRILKTNSCCGEDKIKEVKSIYDSLELGCRCHERIERYALEAVSALGKIKFIDDADRSFFSELAMRSMSRTH